MEWEKIGLGVIGAIVLITLLPRVGKMLQDSRKAEAGEWRGVLIPIGLVVAFVVLLILMVRN